jgi:hypothetical protein
MRLEYVPAFLFVPVVARWLVYPLFKAAGRAALLLTSWVLLLFAFTSLDPTMGKGHDLGALGCLGASLLGFLLMARLRPPIPPPRLFGRLWCLPSGLVGFLPRALAGGGGAHTLASRCERRLGQPVLAASSIRVQTLNGKRVQAIALTQDHIFWLEHDPWRQQIGRVLAWRPLTGLAPHAAPRRFRKNQLLELSWPATCELFIGTLLAGADADHFVGQLTASHFQRTPARAS